MSKSGNANAPSRHEMGTALPRPPPEGAAPSRRLGRGDRGGSKHSHHVSTSSSPGTGTLRRLGPAVPGVKPTRPVPDAEVSDTFAPSGVGHLATRAARL